MSKHYRVETWTYYSWRTEGAWRLWSRPRTWAAATKAAREAKAEGARVRIVEVRERLVPVAGRGRR